jgi:hypothetical protein
MFGIVYKLSQWVLQVSGDGNNHVVPSIQAHQKFKKIDYKVIYLYDTRSVTSGWQLHPVWKFTELYNMHGGHITINLIHHVL